MHSPFTAMLGELGLDLALDHERDVPTRALPVCRDAASGFKDVNVDLHVVCLMHARLARQDVPRFVGQGCKVRIVVASIASFS